ncbi:hypothetical protein RJ55_02768 [Drechmeria coniospora]|nr:hypothetical protein RJ55_02768 [Drechmeria coniospora]
MATRQNRLAEPAPAPSWRRTRRKKRHQRGGGRHVGETAEESQRTGRDDEVSQPGQAVAAALEDEVGDERIRRANQLTAPWPVLASPVAARLDHGAFLVLALLCSRACPPSSSFLLVFLPFRSAPHQQPFLAFLRLSPAPGERCSSSRYGVVHDAAASAAAAASSTRGHSSSAGPTRASETDGVDEQGGRGLVPVARAASKPTTGRRMNAWCPSRPLCSPCSPPPPRLPVPPRLLCFRRPRPPASSVSPAAAVTTGTNRGRGSRHQALVHLAALIHAPDDERALGVGPPLRKRCRLTREWSVTSPAPCFRCHVHARTHSSAPVYSHEPRPHACAGTWAADARIRAVLHDHAVGSRGSTCPTLERPAKYILYTCRTDTQPAMRALVFCGGTTGSVHAPRWPAMPGHAYCAYCSAVLSLRAAGTRDPSVWLALRTTAPNRQHPSVEGSTDRHTGVVVLCTVQYLVLMGTTRPMRCRANPNTNPASIRPAPLALSLAPGPPARCLGKDGLIVFRLCRRHGRVRQRQSK